MEQIEIGNLKLSVSDGYLCWIRMEEIINTVNMNTTNAVEVVNDRCISFTHNKLQIVIDALEHLKKDAKRSLKNTPYEGEV